MTEPTVLTAVQDQARRRPSAPALVDGDRRLSYRGLLTEARTRAGALAAAGVGAGDRVAVETGYGAGHVLGLFACWLLDAVPVPVDPAAPAVRRGFQVRHAGCVGSLVRDGADGAVAEAVAEVIRDRPAPSSPGLAYIVFTSGSTGRAKGVEAGHPGLLNFCTQLAAELGLGPRRRMVAHLNPAFDMALAETMAPLVGGGTVVVAPARAPHNPELFGRWLREARVQAFAATPTMFRMLLPYLGGGLPGCMLGSGGEVLPAALAAELLTVGAELWNGYGPTEATVAPLLGRVLPDPADPVPIGRPIAGMTAEILDGQLRRVPPGEPGELHLSGIGLARGYVNDPELTRQAFVAGPDGVRRYRTGDICRVRPDGRYEFRGRADDQVKIRGHRVELGEIEAVAARLAGMAGATAVMCASDGGREELYLVVPAAPGTRPDPAGWAAYLRRHLPGHMLPLRIIPVAELPQNASGKVDRAAVRQCVQETLRERTGHVAPARY
ncbi:amino acid adenylation domain-containing protein [Actinoplanes sp. N902-109]|uniref:amino acid adenylation domain-containing protein n=1 Tax=Actinoplanes sp. (strain N902-109) TaxID=649831 RepID=UPI0003294726|nr:amino acid adenylation domain-containing protein [Actinoplanes sp. N902-109]AGL19080.1 NRPS (OzmO) [Actinoplanes sp. N902-109]